MSRNSKILLLVDNRTRDANGILLIYFWLKAMGCHVVLCNKRHWNVAFEYHQPSMFAISTALSLGPGMEDFWKPYARRSRIVIIPQEGALPEEAGRRTKDFYLGTREGGSFRREVVRIYTWGRQTAEWILEDEIFRPEQVLVTGTPRLDPARLHPILGARKKGLDPASGQVSVGFAVSHGTVNPYNTASPAFMSMYEYRYGNGLGQYYENNGGMEDYIWMLCRILRNEFDIIDLFRKVHSDSIYIRPDPFERESGYDYLKSKISNLTCSHSEELWAWLRRLYCMVTYYSTTSIEALLSGIPVITPLNTVQPLLRERIHLSHFVDPHFLDYMWQPSSIEETISMISAARCGELDYSPAPAAFEKYLAEFYDWPRTEPSSLTIARDIARLNESEPLVNTWAEPTSARMKKILDESLVHSLVRHVVPYRTRMRVGNVLYGAFQLWGDVMDGQVPSMQRYHFYPWHKASLNTAARIWRALKDDRPMPQAPSNHSDQRKSEDPAIASEGNAQSI